MTRAAGIVIEGGRMKPASAATTPSRVPLRGAADEQWRERSGRLFAEFERAATAMLRRAFRDAFSDEEIEDIYAGAWVGTLRSLAGRHGELSDDEIRSYLLTAVANQASKELRRRRRKPAAPLELVGPVADAADTPDERAAGAEDARLTRDLLASLPARRRAVILLRYGWGLEPRQVCGLVKGLSPRAYRKEITRGVDELTAKMKSVESGEWCAEREPILKAYAAGLANADQARQAQAHISHCRSCSEFVARLSGHLHDLGGAIAAAGAVDGLDGHISFGDRALALGDRARDAVAGLSGNGGTDGAESAAAQLAT
ncbi:MAG: RNA polymerase sigma factor, partial [Thermoleophilaceae bacterium]